MTDLTAPIAPECVLLERYRLERRLAGPDALQGSVWRAVDTMAGDIPVVIRQLEDDASRQRMCRSWPVLQSLLHPQLPRCGELFEAQDCLWTVRDWQEGSSYAQLLDHRRERQMVFGAGEVLLLLRQVLPVLAVLHGRELVHGDVNPRNLLRRDSDGLPVLIDFALVQTMGGAPLDGATAGYAPRAQGRREPSSAWMDLHALGVSALVLLSGRAPETLLSTDADAWLWPEDIQLDPDFRSVLERLISELPDQRFEAAADALKALEVVPVPDSTGPTARSDRTVALAPAVLDLPDLRPPSPPDAATTPQEPLQRRRRSRAEEREKGAEGRLWPVVAALAVSALIGTAIGWYLLSRDASRGMAPSMNRDVVGRTPPVSLPPAEVDERQQLLSRLRALQVDRTWFLQLVDSSLLSRFPERGGRLPSDALEDAPLRRVWNDLAEEWLARIEQLPPVMRSRLGQLEEADWQQQQQVLVRQGINPTVVEQLVSAGARTLLPGDSLGSKPDEPYRQLWFAAAIQSLADVEIEAVNAQPRQPTTLSLRVPSGGARLISINVPPGYGLVLGINGTPLMQMTVYGSEGQVEEDRGPLRVVTLPAAAGSPMQVLVTNEGVASGLLTLSCRADRPAMPTPRPLRPTDPSIRRPGSMPVPDPGPLPDSATGAPMDQPTEPDEYETDSPPLSFPLMSEDDALMDQ